MQVPGEQCDVCGGSPIFIGHSWLAKILGLGHDWIHTVSPRPKVKQGGQGSEECWYCGKALKHSYEYAGMIHEACLADGYRRGMGRRDD